MKKLFKKAYLLFGTAIAISLITLIFSCSLPSTSGPQSSDSSAVPVAAAPTAEKRTLVVSVKGAETELSSEASMSLVASTDSPVPLQYSWLIDGTACGASSTCQVDGSRLSVGAHTISLKVTTPDASAEGSTSVSFAVIAAKADSGSTAKPGAYIGPPSPESVGPRLANLAAAAGGYLAPGDYSGAAFASAVSLSSSGSYAFVDCDFQAGFSTVFGGKGVTRVVSLDHCRSMVGLYFEDAGQKGWTIAWCDLRGNTQALRPKGLTISDITTPTPFIVRDTIVRLYGTGSPAAHCEAMQSLGGASMEFSRVRFITIGPYINGTTGQTAAINFNASDSVFAECEFLTANAFYYTIYSAGANVIFKDCKISRGMAGYLYKQSQAPTFVKCVDLESGSAVTTD